MKIFTYTIIFIVLAAIVAGFFIVGSPQKERLRKFDERKISDLQFLQSEILNYWQQKNRLPKALDDLRDDIRGVTIPKDPESGAAYEYRVSATTKFSLCAVFDLETFVMTASPNVRMGLPLEKSYTPDMAPPVKVGYLGINSGNWEHLKGQNCFDRSIDKELYKPRPL